MSKAVEITQLQHEIEAMEGRASLRSAVDNIDKLIEQLAEARQAVASAKDPHAATLAITKLQNPVKDSLDKVNSDLKKVYGLQKDIGKSLDKNFPVVKIPTDNDAMEEQTALINRAIAMHLLREGQFSVASTFLEETGREAQIQSSRHHNSIDVDMQDQVMVDILRAGSETSDEVAMSMQSHELQARFENMYTILQAMRQHDLAPAIAWAREHSRELESRGSNLEFELCKLQYVHLFRTPGQGPCAAYEYARTHMVRFQSRHLTEITRLAGALIFAPNMRRSPYASLFDSTTAFSDTASSFTREFCSLLGLSAESPLYVAATAGAIALPRLVKWMTRAHNAEWTTSNELAFETPMPPSFRFHSIFVCPVSKEQTTAENPPMMLQCGHVIARNSLQNTARGTRFRCSYCSHEGPLNEVRVIVL